MIEYAGNFDQKLAAECAKAFSHSTELGCTVSDNKGVIFDEFGYGCASCELCTALKLPKDGCVGAHLYGMTEAERFGGKYIYFCPTGLTFFVSPILGEEGSAAKITVGPFLMVDYDDFLQTDIAELLNRPITKTVKNVVRKIPHVKPEKVDYLSVLLFMAVGFMNNVSNVNAMRKSQTSERIQSQISGYIMELKSGTKLTEYPFGIEQELLSSIAGFDKKKSQELLNAILGHILFNSGNQLGIIKVRVYELLVLMSRAAMLAGASTEQSLLLSCEFFEKAQAVTDIDKLCFLISESMSSLIDSVFINQDIKHFNVIRKATKYIHEGFAGRLTLEDVAKRVFLSPSYFGKIFKQEMNCTFNDYLNKLRVEKSKELLLKNMRIVDVASEVGFEDQSYFTKVFKRVTDVSPIEFKNKRNM